MRRKKQDRHNQSVVGCCGGGYNTNTTGVIDDCGTERILLFDCGTYTTVVVVVAVANVLVPDAPILVVLVLLLRSGCTSDIVAVAVANLPGTDVRILVVQ